VIVGVVGVARDTTERNQAEAGLRLKAARYELLSRSIRDVCYRVRLRPKAQFEYISPSVSDLLGYAPEEFLADDDLVWNIIHDDDRPLLTTNLSNNDFVRLDWEGRFRRRDGSYIWLEIRSQTDYDGDIAVARTGVARDITRRKRAEDHLKTLVDQLADQQRFESRGRSDTSGPEEVASA
jgi:PAS domain S-box-containing protein